MDMKKKSQIIKDLDKNLGTVMADIEDVVVECKNNYMAFPHTLNYC